MKDNRHHPLRASHEDREAALQTPDTPQTRAPSYALAFAVMIFCAAKNCVRFGCSWNCSSPKC